MKCHCDEIEELRVENDLLREKLAQVEAAYQSLVDEQESKQDVIRHSHE